MRGKQARKGGGKFRPGITPAHAGKTTHTGRMTVKFKDHPRACGENSRNRNGARQQVGSPPRMRGKHIELTMENGQKRITPAHAGKTNEF